MMMQKLQKLRWMIIRWLLTSNEKQDLADICPDIWDDYRELITGES